MKMNVKNKNETRPSQHSLERVNERANIKNAESAARKIALAYERGLRKADFHSKFEKQYLQWQERHGAEAVVFDNFCYIFSKEDRTCITMYALPHGFGRTHAGRRNRFVPRKPHDARGTQKKKQDGERSDECSVA